MINTESPYEKMLPYGNIRLEGVKKYQKRFSLFVSRCKRGKNTIQVNRFYLLLSSLKSNDNY